MALPSVFQQCVPRAEVLAGALPDAIFAADLWDVVAGRAHADYQDPGRFFTGTYPTANLKTLLKDVTERLAGIEGGDPVFRLETGFGGGKTHTLIATVHVAREGSALASYLKDYGIAHFPNKGEVQVAAFVGEESDPLSGNEHHIGGQQIRTYTPWGQLALMSGGVLGYNLIRESDLQGVVPSRADFETALGDRPVLIVIDELILYMARAFGLHADHARARVNSQWPTFFQTLFSIAARRPRTAVILTLPTEQDANRRLTGELKQYIPTVLETIDEVEHTAGRQAKNLTPTQANERAAVLARRLFDSVDRSSARAVAQAYGEYYEAQRRAGAQIDARAFEPAYLEQLEAGYPFHPELIRLFAERLADIPEFQATRGALRLVARTVRAAWEGRAHLGDEPLLQPQHIDLSRSELRDEILARLGRGAFGQALDSDVINPGGATHANEVEVGWPWRAASESSLIVFLHSLPDGSRGLTASEVALAVGQPERDLGYVARALEETERRAWYMRREGDHYLFRTRASVNKRYQERLSQVQAPEVRTTLDAWIEEIYSGFDAFQIIPFPQDHTAIPDSADRVRLALIHYDKECGAVGGGDRLNFTRSLYEKTGVNGSPRRYRNNLLFLLAESTRVDGLKDAVRALIAWERVAKDIETEQVNLAQASGTDFRALRDQARRGATGVPAEFVALENDHGEALEKLGTQEVNVRTRLVEAYRVLAFPPISGGERADLFTGGISGPLLECYRVDFGENPEPGGRGRRNPRQTVAERPILQTLRGNQKLVLEPPASNPVVLAPSVIARPPLWQSGERRVATEDVWDRLRREPSLPIVLRQTDLLPTLRAGLTASPDPLWIYYAQPEKRVYNAENANTLSPVLAAEHFLYEASAAVEDRILPVTAVAPQEVWDHLWTREGADRAESVITTDLLDACLRSPHFPVLPDRSVLWQALRDGAAQNRWVLYLRGPSLAIGSSEMGEWPGTPRFENDVELWSYQAALDRGIYPRAGNTTVIGPPLTAANLRARCWSNGQASVEIEELERAARSVWPDLSRPRLEQLLREGVRQGLWGAWKQSGDETFFSQGDTLPTTIPVSQGWRIVDESSPLRQSLDALRPGRGPQPVVQAGTPREALTNVWSALEQFRDVQLAELLITANDRDTFDNTLLATWADRPANAVAHASVHATGQRQAGGRQETVALEFEGRFEEVRGMLSPIWPFQGQGELDITITERLVFDPPLPLADTALETYRTALMNANQGVVEVRAVPARPRNVVEEA